MPADGDCVLKMLDSAIAKRDALGMKKDKFIKNLQTIVAERDITPDKMKNPSTLVAMRATSTFIRSKLSFKS